MKDIYNFELVEVSIPAGSTIQRINIQDQPKLRDTVILGIESFSAENIATAPSGQPVVNENTYKNAYLVLVDAETSEEKMFNIPLVFTRRLRLANTDSGQFVTNLIGLAGMRVNFSKSYVFLASTASVSPTDIESICIAFLYEKKTKATQPARSVPQFRRK